MGIKFRTGVSPHLPVQVMVYQNLSNTALYTVQVQSPWAAYFRDKIMLYLNQVSAVYLL